MKIVTDEDTENYDYRTRKILRLTRKVSTKIEPFFIVSNRFLNDESPLINEVKRSGIEIV